MLRNKKVQCRVQDSMPYASDPATKYAAQKIHPSVLRFDSSDCQLRLGIRRGLRSSGIHSKAMYAF